MHLHDFGTQSILEIPYELCVHMCQMLRVAVTTVHVTVSFRVSPHTRLVTMAACRCIANCCPYPTPYLCGWQTWGRRSNLIATVSWEGARAHSPRPNATHE